LNINAKIEISPVYENLSRKPPDKYTKHNRVEFSLEKNHESDKECKYVQD